ncbi:hypothetical protein SpCBS45565_g00117 [Spizellomyces sp. 'palustris']|nr:hypothetical protein SpCBS45565_g00117 [Spizellomyces sp. 'palustris']
MSVIPTTLLVLLFALFTATSITAAPAPAPVPQEGKPADIDCMVAWSEYNCCAENLKTSTGKVLVHAMGNGKACPISLIRKEYCLVGDEDCTGANTASIGAAANHWVVGTSVAGAVLIGLL